MLNLPFEAANMTRVSTTGKSQVAIAGAALAGIAFVGTATGQFQLFAGATCSSSLTPVVTFCATSSAVAGGFSPMFLRWPCVVSGTGFCIDLGVTSDPNLILFWSPVSGA